MFAFKKKQEQEKKETTTAIMQGILDKQKTEKK
jgi:hypothetical protein